MKELSSELVKELKDAGFPQHQEDVADSQRPLWFPSLEELIEECGWEFGSLRLSHSILKGSKPFIWFAIREPEDEDKIGVGHSPKEAVAMLWLTLKRK